MKILIADPHPEVLSALRLLLERAAPGAQVEGTGSLVQLLTRCAETCPDLILVDRDLAGSSRSNPHPLPGLVAVLRRLCPRSHVVVMSSQVEDAPGLPLAGADGFISKTDPPDVVLASLKRLEVWKAPLTGEC